MKVRRASYFLVAGLIAIGCWYSPRYDPDAPHYVPDFVGEVVGRNPEGTDTYLLRDGSTVTVPQHSVWLSGYSSEVEDSLLMFGNSSSPWAVLVFRATSPQSPEDCFVFRTDEIWVRDERVNAFRNQAIEGVSPTYLSVPVAQGFTAEPFVKYGRQALCIDSSGRAVEYSDEIR